MTTEYHITIKSKMNLIAISCLFLLPLAYGQFLTADKDGLHFNGKKIFLSGANIAWDSFGHDFGGEPKWDDYYSRVKEHYEKWVTGVSDAGGNAVRVWLHADGSSSPKWDANGFAVGNDTDTIVKDLGTFLDFAAEKNVFVILTLWNLAVAPRPNELELYKNAEKLQRYFEKVLTPLVSGLKSKKALAAYEVINEPGGSVKQNITDSTNKCFDTTRLLNSGANWANTGLSMKEVLHFINLHIDVIKTADPKALVTQGSWNEIPSTDACNYCFNYYKDECLVAGGGKTKGVIDFYQIHAYTWQNKYSDYSPMKRKASELKLDKPVIIGEFSTECSESKNASTNFKWGYESGYSGILSWQYNEGGTCSDKQAAQNEGMSAIKDMTNNGLIKVKISA